MRSVDWVVPAYLPAGGVLAIAAMLEREPVSKREEILEWVLPRLYVPTPSRLDLCSSDNRLGCRAIGEIGTEK